MIAFYRDGLGMTITEQWDRSDTDRGAILTPAGEVSNASIEVLKLGDIAVPGGTPTNLELTLVVHDAHAAVSSINQAGIPIARELEDTPWGHRSFGVDDPDGLRIWIIEELNAE
jgi:uncharacterized glyoxalase superfamily protein PhnB